ncbi:hypothetical protein [Erythrobacter sp. F6033]|uniref:hypothetical protein n=1 Tax=Erythrobacter sp. F6033 TaxID=2926401 RepID=UPI001FF10752|nr:hypothetical protein [Erythrobacter sp. F6033]MCK0129613.1 hypothetical protein [Erythrobacter sp. F6033]
MLRQAATICVAALLVGGFAPEQESEVILDVISSPIEADETHTPYLYKRPKEDERFPGSGVVEQEWSMLGREDHSAETSGEYSPDACAAIAAPAIGAEAVIDRIVKAAMSHRVVIINESHKATQHRDFSRKVIAALRPHGFGVLAAETFANKADSPDPVALYAGVSHIDYRLGWYSREPVFGEMLREAKRLGFRFAAYEQVYDPNADRTDVQLSIARREQAQAENLVAIIAEMGAEEKLIVHVGYSHAREFITQNEDGSESAWMAARLKRMTGIDPLTISQTHCRGSGDAVQLSKAPATIEGWFDYIVDHPVPSFRDGKPEWRFGDGRVEISSPDELAPTNGPFVIEAFHAGDPFNAVPADRIWVDPGESVKLALRPGRYTVRAVRPASEQGPGLPATPE